MKRRPHPYARVRLAVILFLSIGLLEIPARAQSGRPTPDCRYASQREAAEQVPSGEETPRWFPAGDFFRPLLADPKQPQFVLSRWRVKPEQAGDFAAGNVAFGENFGIYRHRYPEGRPCNGWQINLSGAVFAQFNLNAPSSDLVNADYVIGFPLTFRRNDFSGRLRVYHQSSHLGDEFLLGNPGINRVNLSFEEVEAIFSYAWKALRAYGGSGYLVRREPDLERLRWQYGGEVRMGVPPHLSPRFVRYPLFWVTGLDIKQFQHHDYDLNYSVKTGVELLSDLTDRRLRILAGYYKGFNPFGQFYDQKVEAFGLEMNFGF